jgi:hypothetical protein
LAVFVRLDHLVLASHLANPFVRLHGHRCLQELTDAAQKSFRDTCIDTAGPRSAQVESELRIILHAAALDNLQTPV